MELKERINAVVQARAVAKEATEFRAAEYQKWQEANEQIFTNEAQAKLVCQELEAQLREATILAYAQTGNKAPEVGVGIRMMTRLAYESAQAMNWAMEHKLALKLDTNAFEKIAKTNNLPFVAITEEPQATIATELKELA